MYAGNLNERGIAPDRTILLKQKKKNNKKLICDGYNIIIIVEMILKSELNIRIR